DCQSHSSLADLPDNKSNYSHLFFVKMGSVDPITELLTPPNRNPSLKIRDFYIDHAVARSLTMFGPPRGVTKDATTDSGFALRSARTRQETGLHHYCSDDPGARYRCKQRHLQRRRWRPAALSALARLEVALRRA